MRKLHKQQILELLKTLYEANNELFKPANKDVIPILVNDITEFCDGIVDYIKTNSCDSDVTRQAVKAINDYVALLANPDKQVIKNQTHSIDIAVSRLIVDKYQMVFVVDSGAKSDCLLPIYKVAEQDPNCDAVWLPVPLYELDILGFRSKMMHDGSEFYRDVKVTDWRTFDIEKNNPDVIFTNNGYDGENRVTQLHPDFWTTKLKECTDCLVYVPYFVCEKLDEDTKHFANLTSIQFFDLVVVENEEVRKGYIKFSKELYGSKIKTCKFVALGSPKYDSLIEYEQKAISGTLEIPDGWREKIYNPDGTKKKVVFYNTSLSTLLSDTKKGDSSYLRGSSYMKKVEFVLEAFSRCDNLVLLWRPHPLMTSTIHSMAPHLLDVWNKLVMNFVNEGFGIYDESADLHRAIAVSDVYFGDGSSLTHLFEKCCKRICWQIFDGNSIQNNRLLEWIGCYSKAIFMIENEIYALDSTDYIYKVNIKNNEFDFYKAISASKESDMYDMHNDVEINNNKAYFFPHNDDRIVVLNPKTEKLEYYELGLKEEFFAPLYGKNKNFFGGIFYKSKVFMTSCAYRNIVAYNFDTKETEHCLDLRVIFPKEKIHLLFNGWAWLDKTTVLWASLYTNEVLEFNLETYEHKIHKLGQKDKSFQGIYKNGNNFFLVGRQPFVAKWDYTTGKFTYYDNLPSDFTVLKASDHTFVENQIEPYNDRLILIGGFNNMVLEFDFNTCTFKKIDCFDKSKEVKSKINKKFPYSICNYVGGKDFYFIRQHEALCHYDFESGEFEELCEINVNFSNDVIESLNNKFFDKLVNCDKKNNNGNTVEPCSGKIYEYVRKLVSV